MAEPRTAERIAEQDLVVAALDQQMAQLALNLARAELDKRTIRSPVDGIVTERALGPGEYLHKTPTS